MQNRFHAKLQQIIQSIRPVSIIMNIDENDGNKTYGPEPHQLQQEFLTLNADCCSTAAARIDNELNSQMKNSVHVEIDNDAETEMEQHLPVLPEIKDEDYKPISTKKSVIILAVIFLASALVLVYLYCTFPELSEDEKKSFKIPFSIEDAKNLGKVLEKYKETHYVRVLLAISLCILFLHTFALPGTFMFMILSGYLFPFPVALGMVCLCITIGSSFCYLLSLTVGRKLAYKYFPEKIKSYANVVKKHQDNVLFVIIFWRIVPIFPSFLLNICTPLVDVSLLPFFTGTFIGVIGPCSLGILSGKTLKDVSSSSNLWSWSSILLLVGLAILALLPILYKAKMRRKSD